YPIKINKVHIYNGTAGSSGTTEFDIKVASPGGAFASIFSTVGSIDSTAASNIWTDSGSDVPAQTGVVKPVLNQTVFQAGQALRFDLTDIMVGAVDCKIEVYYEAL